MIQLIAKTFWGAEIDSLEGGYDFKGKITVQSDGDIAFKMDWKDFRNTSETVKMFNILELQRFNDKKNQWEYLSAFVIDDIDNKENHVEIKAVEFLKFFKHRYTKSSDSYIGESADFVAESLLDYTNDVIGITPVVMGKKENSTLVDFEYKRQRIYDSWKNISGSAACDIWIDKNEEKTEGDSQYLLNIGDRGEDKTDEVPAITYDYYQPDSMNIQSISAAYKALDFATRVIGKSSSMESIQESEKEGFPVIEKIQNFSGISSIETLDLRTADYLKQISSTLPTLSLSPSNSQVLMEEVKIGDYVPTYCRFKSFLVEADMRVVEIKFSIGDNLEENITLSLSETKNFQTSIIDVIGKMEARVNEI